MKPRSKREEQSDESDDDDYPAHIKKQQKSSKKKDLPPDFSNFGDIENSDYAKNMLQARGFNNLESELAKEAGTKANKVATKAGSKLLPSQAVLSLQELESELAKAQKLNDKDLIISLLDTIISKDMHISKRRGYLIKFSAMLYDMKKYKACIDSLKDLQASAEFTSEKAEENFRIYTLLAKCKVESGYKIDGFTDYYRASALLMMLENYSKEGTENNSWLESDFEKYRQIYDELTMLLQVRFNKEKSGFTEYALSYMTNTTPKTFVEFRNRKVLSVACGEHHVIALVDCSITNLYEIKKQAPQEPDPYSGDTHGYPLVYGWGENTLGQALSHTMVENIERPTINPMLIGKNISCISATRASSACGSVNGEVFEWGFKRAGLEQTFTLKEGIVEISQSQHAIGVVTVSGKVWVCGALHSGEVEILNQKVQFQLPISDRAKKIAMGSNHMIILSETNKISAMGNNTKGQAGFGQEKEYMKEITEIQIPNYYGKPQKIIAWNDISGFINQEGELYLWGLLAPNVENLKEERIIWSPQNFELSDPNPVISLAGTFRNIYAVPDNGDVHCWDLQEGIKFKRVAELRNHSIRTVFCTRSQVIALRSSPEALMCYVKDGDEGANPQSFIPFTLSVQLMDENGKFAMNPWHPLRFYVFISDKPSKRQEELETMAIHAGSSSKAIASNGLVKIAFAGDPSSSFNELKECEGGVYDLTLCLEKQGKYYLYLLVNEELIKGMPKLLDVSKSSEEDKKQQEAAEKAQKEMANRAKTEELRAKRERELQEELEEKERRLVETKERAEERHKEYLLSQREAKTKEEEERKQKKDLLTGGGFDLDKLQAMRKAVAQKEEIKEVEADTKNKMLKTSTKSPITSPGLQTTSTSFKSVTSSQKMTSAREPLASKGSLGSTSKPTTASTERSAAISSTATKKVTKNPITSQTTKPKTPTPSTTTSVNTKPTPVALGSKIGPASSSKSGASGLKKK